MSYHTGEWLDSEYARSGPSAFYPDGRFRLPVFARAGAIIPWRFVDDQTMNVLGKRLDGSVHDELIVRVFADPAASEFTLFEDDRLTIAYQNGAVRQTVIRQRQSGEQVTVAIEPASGTYDGAADRRDNVVRLSVRDLKAVAGVSLNGARLEPCGLSESVEGCSRGWYLDGSGQVVARSGPEDAAVGKTFAFQLAPGEGGGTP